MSKRSMLFCRTGAFGLGLGTAMLLLGVSARETGAATGSRIQRSMAGVITPAGASQGFLLFEGRYRNEPSRGRERLVVELSIARAAAFRLGDEVPPEEPGDPETVIALDDPIVIRLTGPSASFIVEEAAGPAEVDPNDEENPNGDFEAGIDVRTDRGEDVPDVIVGTQATARHSGMQVARGRFE
jgi:hypothetical protein